MMTLEQLKKIREQYAPIVALRHQGADATGCPYKREVVVCGGTGCMSSDSQEIKNEFDRLVKENNLEKDVLVYQSQNYTKHLFVVCLLKDH